MKILPLPVSLLLLIATAACSPQNATEIAAQSTAESAFSPGPVIKNKAENANAGIIKALLDKNTRIIVCGQSAAFYEIKNEDLLPGVEMALSAMTAHAVLQQEGYTLNPF